MVAKKFDEFVIFTKIFGRSVQLSSRFGKTFSSVKDACEYKDKVYQADIYRKNNTCTSCVFNGFKYIYRNLLKADHVPGDTWGKPRLVPSALFEHTWKRSTR